MERNLLSVLIIGYVWPEPRSSAAGRRMMQLIALFQQEGWEITFASSAAESEHSVNLGEYGLSTAEVNINSSDFDTFITQLQPDIVMFDRFVVEEQFGWRVAEHCPDALRLLDTEDLHSLRRVRKKAVMGGQPFSTNQLLESEVAKREIASILRCDLSLIISEYEMELLADLFRVDEALLHYLPFLLDSIEETDIEKWPSFEARDHFLTIGNFRHPPNWDSVQYLKREIWPRIREELPSAELHVYGAYASEKATALNNPGEGFYIKGRAEEAGSVVRQARVCLAPLRFGAGLKGKLVEAMQCGTPSVTTPVGAEGLQGDMEWAGIIASEPEDIAEAAVELFTDQSAWEKARQNGVEIINTRFSSELFETDFIDRIMKLREELDAHRRRNFTGGMLRHHTMASTKYMARWIEAKNS